MKMKRGGAIRVVGENPQFSAAQRQALDEHIAVGAAKAIAVDTHRQYYSMVRTLVSNTDEFGSLPPTFEGLTRLLLMPTTTLSARSAAAYRSALTFFYDIHGIAPDPGGVAQLERVLTGYCHAHPPTSGERGPLDYEKLKLLLRMLVDENYKATNIVDAIIIQFAFGVRGDQLKKMCSGDFRLMNNGRYFFTGKRHKQSIKKTAHEDTEDMETHEQDPRLTTAVEAILAKHPNPKKFMFAAHRPGEVTKIVKRAVVRYGWDKSLSWTGSHNIRHGALHDANVLGGLAEVERRGAHRSSGMMEHYSKPVENRRRKDDGSEKGDRRRGREGRDVIPPRPATPHPPRARRVLLGDGPRRGPAPMAKAQREDLWGRLRK